MLVREEPSAFPRATTDSGHPEDQALAILVSRAVGRRDQALATALAALPPRTGQGRALVEADCPILARIATICDPIESLAWRRAVVHAGVRGDRRRAHVLLDLAARRCSD